MVEPSLGLGVRRKQQIPHAAEALLSLIVRRAEFGMTVFFYYHSCEGWRVQPFVIPNRRCLTIRNPKEGLVVKKSELGE